MFLPGAYWKVLDGQTELIQTLKDREGRAHVQHDIPQPYRPIAGCSNELVLVDLGPSDVKEPILRFKAGIFEV
jgi:hypothetical protein